MKTLDTAAIVLLIVGGINWGLVGLFNYNLVTSLLGPVEKLVYILVGASAVYFAANYFGNSKGRGKK